jgi:glycosyltransferase involved in cell wall biosynthesis
MAIERLLDDPAYAAQLGAALKRDFAQNRSWEAAAGAILKVCEQLQV